MYADSVKAILQQHPTAADQLLPALRACQHRFRHIPEEAIDMLATHFCRSAAEIHGVITFYDDFTLTPVAEKSIQLCAAEACQARGARALQTIRSTADDIDIKPVYCLGNCACGPNARIGDRLYPRLTPERFQSLLQTLANQ